MNIKSQIKSEIYEVNIRLDGVDPELGPSTTTEFMLEGRRQGLSRGAELIDEFQFSLSDLSSQILANARGALERSRHEAYPGTQSELQGYARGLQDAGERLQALLNKENGETK